MNEKSLSVLEQYSYRVRSTRRVRGSYYCETNEGLMLLKECENSQSKLEIVEKLHLHLEQCNMKTDMVYRNINNELISQGADGGRYILKKWYEHRESEPEDEADIVAGVKTVANFHAHTKNTTNIFDEGDNIPAGKNLLELYEKHNQEMKKIRSYIAKLKNKSEFEFKLRENIDEYYEQALVAIDMIKECPYEEMYQKSLKDKSLNHGNSQYHSVIMAGNEPVLVNMIRLNMNVQIVDLYVYLRKIMEKNNWDVELGKKVINAYNQVMQISKDEKYLLKAMFCYPDKFWKIINSYYNSNKAWVSEKNSEKLKRFQEQEEIRQHFIKHFN